MPRARNPIRTSIPLVRQIFEIADRKNISILELARRTKSHPNNIRYYRAGVNSPGILILLELANAVGHHIELKAGTKDGS